MMDEVIAYTIMTVALFAGLGIGIWTDVFKRANIFRIVTHKEYGILAITSPDNNQITEVVVNFNSDVVQYKGNVWVIEQNKIFRADKPERGFRLDRADLPKRWVGGIPMIFVNESSFLPIDVLGNAGAAKPGEVSSVILSWVNNQLAKGMNTMKNQQMLIMIALILSLVAAGFALMSWMKAGDVLNAVAVIDARTTAWANAGMIINNNGALVVKNTTTVPPNIPPNVAAGR